MRRLWGIRHVRYFIAAWRFEQWFVQFGCFVGAFPNPRDTEHLQGIWEGKW